MSYDVIDFFKVCGSYLVEMLRLSLVLLFVFKPIALKLWMVLHTLICQKLRAVVVNDAESVVSDGDAVPVLTDIFRI